MDMIKIAALGILAALTGLELKSHRATFGMAAVCSVTVFMLILSLGKLTGFMSQISALLERTGQTSLIMLLLKALGISYLCEFSAGICRDCGFTSLSSQIRIFAKLYILILGMPILLAFIDSLEQFS